MIIKNTILQYEEKKSIDTETEQARYREAADILIKRLMDMINDIKDDTQKIKEDIINSHIMMIKDPDIISEIERLIQDGNTVEAAVDKAYTGFVHMIEAEDDEWFVQRAYDIKDVRDGLLGILLKTDEIKLSGAFKNIIIITKELTPSMAATMKKGSIGAVVTKEGGLTSHSAIIAKALSIPAVLSVKGDIYSIQDNDMLIVDGIKGCIIHNPNETVIEEYINKKSEYEKEQINDRRYINIPTVTADNKKVPLMANVSDIEEVKAAFKLNADGIGLFRTEFIYMKRHTLPTEEEQFYIYRQAAEIFSKKPVIIRVFDVGGDKDFPSFSFKNEKNPFLGLRGIRYCLHKKEIFKTQLRALLRAGAYGEVRILLPMISCVEEIIITKGIIEECKTELREEGILFNDSIQIGIMMETASSVIIADLLTKEADFISIGTNDLTQYLMSADRCNKQVEYLYSYCQPALIRSVRHIIKCARQENIKVGMCGEAAADSLMLPLWISFGLDEYSVAPSSIIDMKKELSLWYKDKADEVAEKVLACRTKEEVYDYLKNINSYINHKFI